MLHNAVGKVISSAGCLRDRCAGIVGRDSGTVGRIIRTG